MKKKIAIVTQGMILGGIEKALLSMLENINPENYDVVLYIIQRGGVLEKDIPKWIKVKSVHGDEKSFKEKIIKKLKAKEYMECINTSIFMPLYMLSNGEDIKSQKRREFYLSKFLDRDNEEYDIAISYHNLFTFSAVYTSEYLKARKKIIWGHADIDEYIENINEYRRYYDKYDYIYLVSREAKDKFSKYYPDLKNKTDIFYNIISKEKLNSLSKKGPKFNDEFGGVRILTIGRLSEEKGQEIIPEIVNKLKKNEYLIRWYLIGEGESREIIKNKIKEFNVGNEIILLGSQDNPYTYLKECDIYVQPSKHECYCTTVTEAKCFSKPMVITNVNGSNEQIRNGKDGIIVDYNIDEIYKGIKRLIIDNELYNKINSNLKLQKVDTLDEINKLINVIG